MYTDNENRIKQTQIIDGISVFFSIGIIWIICNLINKWTTPIDITMDINKYFMDEIPRTLFYPEPVEKMQFIISLILLPVLLSIFMFFLNYVVLRIQYLGKWIDSRSTTIIFYVIVSLGFTILFIAENNNTNYFYFNHNFLVKSPVTCIILTIILVFIYLWTLYYNKIAKKLIVYLSFGICLLISLFLSLMNVFSAQTVEDNGIYISHLNAVYHSVAAVMSNQFLLVDIPSQYGLYPHILEPLFRIIGLNLVSFTSVMAILIFGTFYFWIIFLKKNVKNQMLAYLGFFSTLYFGYIFVRFDNIDSYFQYYPLRTIFPALLLYLSVHYFKRKTISIYYLSFVLYSVGALWNIETGIIVFITWIAVLIFDELVSGISKKSIAKSIVHIVKGISVFIFVIIAYSLYIFIRSGSFPEYLEMIQYIKFFYNFGLVMLPMPLIHPWNLVILSYIIGLSISIRSIVDKKDTLKSKMIFMVSIMGLGLFSYYQGRSHDIVLLDVVYPSLLLLTLFSDNILEYIKSNGRRSMIPVAALSVLVIFMMSTIFSTAYNFDKLENHFKYRWSALLNYKDNYITTGIDFIKRYTKQEDKILILSMNSGIYYADTKTKPALNLPGPSEMFLKKDYQIIEETIKGKSLDQIFYDRNYTHQETVAKANEKMLGYLFENYKVDDISSGKNIIRFIPRDDVDNSFYSKLTNSGIIHYAFSDGGVFLKDIINNKISEYNYNLPKVFLNPNFSLEVVVKPDTKQGKHAIIAGNHPGEKGPSGFVIQQDEDKQNEFYFSYGDGREWVRTGNFKILSTQLNYIAVSVNEKVITTYVNGNKINETKVNENMVNSDLPLVLGNWLAGDRPFNGEVKEINLSNNILSNEDVENTWNKIKS
ncbi:LamG domain-containing protein [Paenibacillus elgii]|uniref:LamG domain-containing protein n=1 Tax=Paenibacillus elgii TaxID=189691 RepID=UPI000248CEAE|nr:LamG domain-containing protein [Paenibacillus elgii]